MKYEMTSNKWTGAIKLDYHDNGNLSKAEMPEIIDPASLVWLMSHFPAHEDAIGWLINNTNATITNVDAVMSFDEFWDTYAHKVGSKDEARMYWDNNKKTITKQPMSDTDKINIAKILPAFVGRHSGAKKEFQPLATTFLHGRLWVSEIERLPVNNNIVSGLARNVINSWGKK